MAGPNELELRKALSSDPGQIRRAADAWRKASVALGKVADELESTRSEIEASWTGGADAEAATAAFDQMSNQVRKRSVDMGQGADSLDTAASALGGAKHDYAKLPAVPSAPAPLPTDPTPREKVDYKSASSQHDQAVADRETAAGHAVHRMNAELDQAQSQMGHAVPYHDQGAGGGGAGGKGPGAPTGGSTPAVGGGSGPVGPYSTSTAGTHAGSPRGAGAVLVGTPVLGGAVAATGGRPGRGSDEGSADGVVGGKVPASAGEGGAAEPGATGGVVHGVAGSGATLGVTGGGAAAILGGRGIASGARSSARGSGSAASEVEVEAAAGRTVTGRSTSVTGGRSGAVAEENLTGGRPGAVAEESVLGGRPAGATGAVGTPRAGMSGIAEGTRPGGSAGSRTVTGGRSGEAGAGSRRGSSLSGQRGNGREEERDRRKGMIMAEDWIDDDDVAPEVIE